MAETRDTVSFLLNDAQVSLAGVKPSDTLLDFLRLKMNLVGTKEGCAEGDCGACTVLIGRLFENELVYETVNSCIRFLASLDGCHIVTVEHLKRKDGTLHPVQKAMVDYHGSQCGFCTPGFIMSLYALWMSNPNPSDEQIETSLQGNLCRCTGYAPIVRAAKAVTNYGSPEDDPLNVERQAVIEQLKELRHNSLLEIVEDDQHLLVPSTSDQLAEVRRTYPDSTIVSGSTDVGLWVTKDMRDISPAIFVGNVDDLRRIDVSDSAVTIGAGVSYSDFQSIIIEHMPQLSEYWNRIGGEQVRNMGTIGGNIANGSPIGDTPPPLIALGAELTLRCGDNRRTILLEEFFLEYGKQDRSRGDFLESIRIPKPKSEDFFAAYKISKRIDEDISAVTLAARARIKSGVLEEIVIACGGMAGIPKRAHAVEAALSGKEWNTENIEEAISQFGNDFTPLSDWRASAEYRIGVTQNLLRRFFLESTGQLEGLRLQRRVSA